MTREELVNKIGNKELNYNLVEGAIANMYKDFEINNTILAYRLLYAFMLSYGFFEERKAEEVFEKLILGKSAFELSSIVRDTVPINVVEYYEKIIEIEHLTSLNIISNSLLEGLEGVDEAIKEAEVALEEFENKFKK